MREIEEPSNISEAMENFWKRIETGEIETPPDFELEEDEEVILLNWKNFDSGYTPAEERKIQQEAFRESLGTLLHKSQEDIRVFVSHSKGHYTRWDNYFDKSGRRRIKIRRYRNYPVEVILICRERGITTTWKSVHPELGRGGFDDNEQTEQEVLKLIDLQRNNS